jgi:acetyl-CoA decarbonylase/synthase complex subunit alpha
MSSAKIKADEIETSIGKVKGLEIKVGKLLAEEWEEACGPTPAPGLMDLRHWDQKLLSRYNPMYAPLCDMCCLCTYGKCDLSGGKKGACGIGIEKQQGRIVLLACCIGTSAHGSHARELVQKLIEKYGPDHPIDVGDNIAVEAPLVRLIHGSKPTVLADLVTPLEYGERQLMNVLSATATGQEGNSLDFESKALHVSMIDHMFMEIGDLAQVVALPFPRGDADTPLIDVGMGCLDQTKPIVLTIGHNVLPGAEVLEYLEKNGLDDEVELAGICCTAQDLARLSKSAKVVGPLSKQLRFIKLGFANVIMVDEQCVRADVLEEAMKLKTPVIATTSQICYNLPDRTGDVADEVVGDLLEGKSPGALIRDETLAAEVAVRVAVELNKKGGAKPLSTERLVRIAERCTQCGACLRECQVDLDIPAAMERAGEGDFSLFSEFYERCIGCGRCEAACPQDNPIVTMINTGAAEKISKEKYKMRAGRGPVQDVEIRNVGAPIVLGEIPGIIAFAGCPNYRNGYKEIGEMAKVFLDRRFIVVTSGCAAMDLAAYTDEDGKSLYELYPGDFDGGCLTNVGSCVANAHIAGAAIKVASIFAGRNLRGNFEEIADYVLNRVGAVGIAWGAMSQKAASIATGFNRMGVPVIVGTESSKYRRTFLGREDQKEKWQLHDARTGDTVEGEPAPLHLLYVADSKDDAIVAAAKLCLRPNDTSKGRQIKLTHYVDLHKKYMGSMPDDLHLFVRTEADIPITMKDEILAILKENEWEPKRIPDPTIVERLVRGR